jgi:hypothetical protein
MVDTHRGDSNIATGTEGTGVRGAVWTSHWTGMSIVRLKPEPARRPKPAPDVVLRMTKVRLESNASTDPPSVPPGLSQVPAPFGQTKREWTGLMKTVVPGGSPFKISWNSVGLR